MRVLTLVLGVIGVVVAALGIWGYFVDWLNLLGVIVPPIGAIIIVDQLVFRRGAAADTVVPAVRWQPFAAWAVGSGLAFLVDRQAPGLSTVVVGLVASAVAYGVFAAATRRTSVAEPVRTNAL
jgi:cytosine permease